MMKKKSIFNRIFYNNKILALFSVLLAFIIWLAVAVIFSPEDERVVEDIPVKIEVSEVMKTYGLTSFIDEDYTVDVTVKGKRYNVSPKALKAEDISVEANTNNVSSPGNYTLQVVATNNSRLDFEIISISLRTIDAFFDVPVTREFQVDDQLYTSTEVVPDGYYAGDRRLSASTVQVSGPETEVDKIIGITATVALEEPITETETFTCTLGTLSSSENEPKYISYLDNIKMTVPVYRKATLTTSVNFINSPADYIASPLQFTVSPSSALFGVSENSQAFKKGVMNVGTIDYSEIAPGKNTFSFVFESDSSVLIEDGVTDFTVTVDAANMASKTITVPVSSAGAASEEGGEENNFAQDSITVTVVGPEASLASIGEKDIAVSADVANTDRETTEVPLTVTVPGSDDCWVYGTYTVNLK